MTAMKDTVAEAGRQLAEQFRAAEEQRTHRLGALALREQIHGECTPTQPSSDKYC